MSEHTHRTLIEGCYRCDLNRDELPPEHECNAGDFDRVLCGCDVMHSYCDICGALADVCTLDVASEQAKRWAGTLELLRLAGD